MTRALKIYSMFFLLHYSTSASKMLTYKLHTTSLVLDINLIPDSFPGVAVPNTGFFVTLSSEIQWRLGTTNRLLQQKCMQYAKTAEIQKKKTTATGRVAFKSVDSFIQSEIGSVTMHKPSRRRGRLQLCIKLKKINK